MEKNINIAAILEDKPLLLKFYSTTFGRITFNGVHKGKVYFFSEDTNAHSVKQNGEMYDGGECIIFPSKEMRDWEKFSWKKGDVLVMDGFRVVFDKWVGDDYTRFNAVHLITSSGVYFNKPSQNRYSPISNFITKYWRKMTDAETKIYMDSLERKCGGKLNLATLEIEKHPEFKDGDVVVTDAVPSLCYSKCIFILKGDLNTGENCANSYIFYNINNNDFCFDVLDTEIRDRNIHLATEEEKQHLFDALAKKGKAWDAEKKQIVDLKPKVELKPFDNVLVRHQKTEEWRANIFSHTDKTDEYLDYVCVNGRWEFCIPYEGNESLLGTTKDVEG